MNTLKEALQFIRVMTDKQCKKYVDQAALMNSTSIPQIKAGIRATLKDPHLRDLEIEHLKEIKEIKETKGDE